MDAVGVSNLEVDNLAGRELDPGGAAVVVREGGVACGLGCKLVGAAIFACSSYGG